MKPKEVERLRATLPTYLTALCGIPSELDEPGLVGVQVQSESSKPVLCGIQETLCVPLMLETHHEIIGVSHDDCVACDLVTAPFLLEPQVEDVVQVDVRQDW